MLHIIDRFVIHFFSSAGILLCALFALRWAERRWKLSWLPYTFKTQLIVAALAVFAISTLREAFDVYNGQLLIKAVTDYISWLTGLGCSVYALYRIRSM